MPPAPLARTSSRTPALWEINKKLEKSGNIYSIWSRPFRLSWGFFPHLYVQFEKLHG